jgi:hypothetical protein
MTRSILLLHNGSSNGLDHRSMVAYISYERYLTHLVHSYNLLPHNIISYINIRAGVSLFTVVTFSEISMTRTDSYLQYVQHCLGSRTTPKEIRNR